MRQWDDGKAALTSVPQPVAVEAPSSKRKLSYKDARELELLPARIQVLEADIAARTQAMQDPAFFRQDNAAIVAANAALADLQAQLDTAYLRWQTLEG